MPIARLYETEQQAQDAANKLSSEYPQGGVHLFTPSSGGDVAASLAGAGFDSGDAAAYAAEVAQGRSVVASAPAFGQGVLVKSVLDEFGPIPMSPLPSAAREANSRYTPFSEFLGVSVLTKRTQQAWWWGRELKRHDIASFGIPLLRKPNIISFGIPRLNRMYNLSFGIPRLNRAYNLSFGIPRLNRAYNLSAGIPRLIYNR